MSAAAPRGRRAATGAPVVPRTLARLVGFVVLGMLGALTWGAMVTPARSWALCVFVVAAAVAGVLLTRTAGHSRLIRWGTGLAVVLALGAAGLIAAGVPLRLLAPSAWPTLGAGLLGGGEVAPNVRVPYSGGDAWVRAVLVLGAPLILGLAAVLAFLPRRNGGLGFPVVAAALLTAAVAVPAVQRPGDAPVLVGAVLAFLLVAFLGLERLSARGAPVAAGLVAAATVVGVIAAPALDADRPLVDYEEIARSLTPAAGTQFSWDHRYGPMDWSRDGNEVLRVRASRGTYWKTATLMDFDGLRWVREPAAAQRGLQTEIDRARPEWISRLRVTITGMTTEEFVGAGTMLSVSKSPRQPVVSGPGEFRVDGRPLRSGHSYEVEAYVPRPSARALAASGTRYPDFVTDALAVRLPPESRSRPGAEIRFAPFGSAERDIATVDGQAVVGEEAQAAIARSPYARTHALARRLAVSAETPYAYMRAVERHLSRRFAYSESPPARAVPLDAFLFTDRSGYCQQFSGAMALLLRMGGIPTRVATGFSPGAYDRDRKEYVVRDLDAHSWVEAYVPGTGWVALDPTPSDAPARSRDLGSPPDRLAPRPAERDPSAGSERALDPRPLGGGEGAASGDGVPLVLIVAIVLAALVAVVVAVPTVRRRRARARAPVPTALEDLERALRRVGAPLTPGTTLRAVGSSLAGTPGESYVRALERARWGPPGPGADAGPGAADRAGLRRALGAGRGPLRWLRAWWALPPG